MVGGDESLEDPRMEFLALLFHRQGRCQFGADVGEVPVGEQQQARLLRWYRVGVWAGGEDADAEGIFGEHRPDGLLDPRQALRLVVEGGDALCSHGELAVVQPVAYLGVVEGGFEARRLVPDCHLPRDETMPWRSRAHGPSVAAQE